MHVAGTAPTLHSFVRPFYYQYLCAKLFLPLFFQDFSDSDSIIRIADNKSPMTVQVESSNIKVWRFVYFIVVTVFLPRGFTSVFQS